MYGRGKVASLIQAILSKDDAMLAILLQDGKLAAYASSTSIFKNNISPLAKDNPTILIHIATKFGTAKAVEALLKKDTDNKFSLLVQVMWILKEQNIEWISDYRSQGDTLQ